MKFLIVSVKELVLLRRDRAGLIVLFIMPAVLVMTITLVQENIMKLTGQKQTSLLVLDQDLGRLGTSLFHRLQSANIDVSYWKADEKTIEDVRSAVVDGEFQVALVIPEGTSVDIEQEAAKFGGGNPQLQAETSPAPVPLLLFFDPAIMPTLRNGITAQLDMVVELFSLQTKVALLRDKMANTLSSFGVESDNSIFSQEFTEDFLEGPLLTLSEGSAHFSNERITPSYNPVQQNVPAWGLFGMFFTAIPLAGSLLQERHSGILARLASAPVSQISLYMGKVVAYIGICLCQFLLICLIGIYLFPLLGLAPFTISGYVGSILLVTLCSGMAASGYGLFLGSVCSTYEQASTVGATTIVSAAAIGGIMVPVYAMPDIMQRVSLFSPLNWGLNSFQELLVRGNGLEALYADLGRLVAFFLLMSCFSWWVAARKTRT